MEYEEHRFGPGETVSAAIRKYNKKKKIPKDILTEIRYMYTELNGEVNPKVGDTVKIPIYDFPEEPEQIPEPPPVQEQKLETPIDPPVATQEEHREKIIEGAEKVISDLKEETYDIIDMGDVTLARHIQVVTDEKEQKRMLSRQERREAARRKAGLSIDITQPEPKKVEVKEEKPRMEKPFEPHREIPRIRHAKILRPYTEEDFKPIEESPKVEEEKPISTMKVEKAEVKERKKAEKKEKPAPKKKRRNWRDNEQDELEEINKEPEQIKEKPGLTPKTNTHNEVQTRREISMRRKRKR